MGKAVGVSSAFPPLATVLAPAEAAERKCLAASIIFWRRISDWQIKVRLFLYRSFTFAKVVLEDLARGGAQKPSQCF